MTESQWLSGTDLRAMLTFAAGSIWTRHLFTWLGREREQALQRRLRLFLCECWRAFGYSHKGAAAFTNAIEVAERYANGLASKEELAAARKQTRKELAKDPFNWEDGENILAQLAVSDNILNVQEVYDLVRIPFLLEEHRGGTLLRDIFGNPFRPLVPLSPTVRTWNDGLVLKLAEAAYADRALPSGHLNGQRFAVLADALLDAGCTDTQLLSHLRTEGPHVKWCHGLDAILGRL